MFHVLLIKERRRTRRIYMHTRIYTRHACMRRIWCRVSCCWRRFRDVHFAQRMLKRTRRFVADKEPVFKSAFDRALINYSRVCPGIISPPPSPPPHAPPMMKFRDFELFIFSEDIDSDFDSIWEAFARQFFYPPILLHAAGHVRAISAKRKVILIKYTAEIKPNETRDETQRYEGA